MSQTFCNGCHRNEAEERERSKHDAEEIQAAYEQRVAKLQRELERSQGNLRKKDDELRLMLDAVKKQKQNERSKKAKLTEPEAPLVRTQASDSIMSPQLTNVTDFTMEEPVQIKKTAPRAASKKRQDELESVPSLGNTGEFGSSIAMSPFDGIISQVSFRTFKSPLSQFERARRKEANASVELLNL